MNSLERISELNILSIIEEENRRFLDEIDRLVNEGGRAMMEKQGVIDPKITPALKKPNEKLEKEASIDRLDADLTKRLAEKVKDTTDERSPPKR